MYQQRMQTVSDAEIIDLYWARNEDAIKQTDRKYRTYLLTVAMNILQDEQDSEECLNDTYVSAWNSMPPNRPAILKAFLSTIMRRHALVKHRNQHRQKRGGLSQALSLSDLEGIVSDQGREYMQSDVIRLAEILEKYLDSLDQMQRYVFLSRFYYGKSVVEIASVLHVHRSKVNRELTKIRKTLREALEKEGIEI